jgi:hypothetical protein
MTAKVHWFSAGLGGHDAVAEVARLRDAAGDAEILANTAP